MDIEHLLGLAIFAGLVCLGIYRVVVLKKKLAEKKAKANENPKVYNPNDA